jgi:acyl-CoA reductase-like NAD-dependent aldehyde dehydrogenase
MTLPKDLPSLRHADRFFIGGEWVKPESDATIDVIDSGTEEFFFRVAEAKDADIQRAVGAARSAFDDGPWPRMSPLERADHLRAIAAELKTRGDEHGEIWPRESGVLHVIATNYVVAAAGAFEYYADLARTFPFEETATPSQWGGTGAEFALLVREPVGVVGAIIPWNGPLNIIANKLPAALIAGCTVIVKASPEAPGEVYMLAEIADAVGLPPGVINVLTADRPVSEMLVRDPGVDKISFTGSTAAGRRIGSICGERVARCTLELGGKSAAVVLDDADMEAAAATLAGQACLLAGQSCAALTRIIVPATRHDEFVETLASTFSQVKVGDPFDPETQMGPLATSRQRDRVEGYIAKGVAEGATLVTGGGRPSYLERGWYVEPTVFGRVENSSTIAQEEIFGPVLSVIAASDERDAVAIANDTIYGLNASVYTPDIDRARRVAGQLRSGTVGHNAFRYDLGIGFGGFKQSGMGREGGEEGLRSFLETKTLLLDDHPAGYAEQV